MQITRIECNPETKNCLRARFAFVTKWNQATKLVFAVFSSFHIAVSLFSSSSCRVFVFSLFTRRLALFTPFHPVHFRASHFSRPPPHGLFRFGFRFRLSASRVTSHRLGTKAVECTKRNCLMMRDDTKNAMRETEKVAK